MTPTSLGLPAHTDHIGSLLRPRSLIDAFKQFARNELRPDFFEASQDADSDHHEAESHRERYASSRR